MTVQELIDVLSTFPADEPIFARDLTNGDGYPVLGVAPYDDDEPRGPNWALAVEFDSRA